jgi:putative ABC transport system substrate-binding protein
MRKCLYLVLVAAMLLAACGGDSEKETESYTVGIVNLSVALEPTVEGFKQGLLDYERDEGDSVTFIYDGMLANAEEVQPALQRLIDEEVDLILALSTPVALQAKAMDSDIPVLFAGVWNPLRLGLVESYSDPGGNLTGVRGEGFIPKELEWLNRLAPGMTRVYVPYFPDDSAAVFSLETLQETAEQLGLEVVVAEVHSSDEVQAALQSLPDDVDGLFILPSFMTLNEYETFIATALEHKLPLASVPQFHVQAGALMSYSPDLYLTGVQVSRLADGILEGSSPSDLPVETADFFLTINVETAAAIGFEVPDEILRQAHTLIRAEQ